MEALSKIYKGSFFGKRYKLSWRAPIIARTIKDVFSPKRVVDVGCAIGDVVQSLVDLGLDGLGIEGSREAEPYLACDRQRILFHDLRDILPNNCGLFDLVFSLEVAEHIEPEWSLRYIENLCHLGHKILISAAPPGQGGHHHVNCQLPDYWEELFWLHYYKRDKQKESQWKSMLQPWAHRKEMRAYIDNALFFYKVEEK